MTQNSKTARTHDLFVTRLYRAEKIVPEKLTNAIEALVGRLRRKLKAELKQFYAALDMEAAPRAGSQARNCTGLAKMPNSDFPWHLPRTCPDKLR